MMVEAQRTPGWWWGWGWRWWGWRWRRWSHHFKMEGRKAVMISLFHSADFVLISGLLFQSTEVHDVYSDSGQLISGLIKSITTEGPPQSKQTVEEFCSQLKAKVQCDDVQILISKYHPDRYWQLNLTQLRLFSPFTDCWPTVYRLLTDCWLFTDCWLSFLPSTK